MSNLQLKQLLIGHPDCGTYEGWVNPDDRWNGYQQPYFTFEQACFVMDNFEKINPDESMVYNAELDRFEISDAYEMLEAYSAVSTEVGECYPIGAGLWCWFLVEEN